MCAIVVAFAPPEQELYMHVFERARTKYEMFRSLGAYVVSQRLIQIMSTLLPLRRICSGGQLSTKDMSVVSPSACACSFCATNSSAMGYKCVCYIVNRS